MKQYNVDTLTIEELKDLIASGDDSKANQIRIGVDGSIFLSGVVGANNLDGIVGRFETFDANNDYVGSFAASNERYIKRLFHTIEQWKKSPRSYIDIWAEN